MKESAALAPRAQPASRVESMEQKEQPEPSADLAASAMKESAALAPRALQAWQVESMERKEQPELSADLAVWVTREPEVSELSALLARLRRPAWMEVS